MRLVLKFFFINSKATWHTKKRNESIAGKYCRKSMGSGSDTPGSQPTSVTYLAALIYARCLISRSLRFSFIKGLLSGLHITWNGTCKMVGVNEWALCDGCITTDSGVLAKTSLWIHFFKQPDCGPGPNNGRNEKDQLLIPCPSDNV